MANIPQDEYFEWEDIMVMRENEHLKELGCDTSTSRYEMSFAPALNVEDVPICWEGLRTGDEPSAPAASSTNASMSPITTPESNINFPSYDDASQESVQLQQPVQQSKQIAKDDSEMYLHPSKCVDYFSHQWNAEDMSSSWRHVRARERSCKNAERLENASWRSWAKMCFGLKTVSPESINWRKDLDDIYLYGPIQTTPIDDEPMITCSATTEPILKRPSISELLLQGSQLSWTGRRDSTGVVKPKKPERRSVKFNRIVEQCFIVSPQQPLPKSKGLAYKSTSAVISSAPMTEKPATSFVTPSSDISQWTWLTPSEVAELENQLGITSQSKLASTAYAPVSPATSIVRDTAAKSQYVPTHQPQHISHELSSYEDEEDEMMAQYLFDCDFKSDCDTLSPSESMSSDEDQYDDDADFFDGGDLADEKRRMDLHEVPMMESMKQTLYEQVLEEFELEW